MNSKRKMKKNDEKASFKKEKFSSYVKLIHHRVELQADFFFFY